MPPNGQIQIAFDRYLLPLSVTRASFVLLDPSNAPVPPEKLPQIVYDPVARTVTLHGQDGPGKPWLEDTLTYKLLIQRPQSDVIGVHAIDGAGLDPAQENVIAFTVDKNAPAQPAEPVVDFCVDVLPVFSAKCSSPTCHGSGERAAAALIMDTSLGVANTAISRIAHGANNGGATQRAAAPRPKFGVDMPLIDPGNPGNSLLVYKFELAALPANPSKASGIVCTGVNNSFIPPAAAPYVPLAEPVRDSGERERLVLGDYVLGREMPYPSAAPGGYEEQPLTFEEREAVRLWIASIPANGAIRDCGGCGTP